MLDFLISLNTAFGRSAESRARPAPAIARFTVRRSVPYVAATLHGLLALAASAAPVPPVQHYTTTDGLAGSVVREIAIDTDGSMWFACWGRGLSSYDGLHWKSYGTEEGLPTLYVRTIRPDAAGRMWAGTINGIASRVGDRWETVDTGVPGLEAPSVFAICPLPDGSLWFGLHGGEILAFTPDGSPGLDAMPSGRWSLVLEPSDSWPAGAIRAIHARPDGTAIAAGDGGVFWWRDQVWTPDAATTSLETVVEAADGTVYVGGGTGLWRKDPGPSDWVHESGTPTKSAAPMPGGGIAVAGHEGVEFRTAHGVSPVDLMGDGATLPMQVINYFPETGALWVGTKLGVFRIGDYGWTHFPRSPEGVALSGRALYADADTPAVTVDRSGALLQFVDGVWRVIGRLESGGLTSISKGRGNTIWLAGSGRAVQWDLDAGAAVADVALPAGIEAVLETRGGHLYAYGPMHFLQRAGGTWADTPAKPQGELERVTTVLETSNGDLVLSMLVALTHWEIGDDGGLIEKYHYPSDKNFRGLLEEPDGSILTGSVEEGVFRFEGGALTFVMPYDTASSARGAVLFRASGGRLWAGAMELGVAAYQDGRWIAYGLGKGLPSGGSNVIVEDPEGAIWVGIESGGILRYVPSPHPPETVIRQVPRQIPNKDRSVFQFVGWDPWKITAAEDLVYSWRIRPEGGEEPEGGWTPFSGERNIISPSLRFGNYVFEVRASDTDFNVDPTPARAAFTVLPPLWATTGFIVPVAILFLATATAAFLLYRNFNALRLSAEHLRMARDQAEAASRAKSQFLAHVSHEIRTPMNAILGHVQVMQVAGGRTPDDEENLQIISRSGEHLLELINNVLEMAKIEAGRVTVNPTTFNFRKAVGEVVRMLSIQCDTSRVRLENYVDPSAPEFVVADHGKIGQILVNLIGNAIKFTESGTISIRSYGGPTASGPGDMLITMEIEDTGRGIEPPALERIFRPFEQADAGRELGGAGLGLPITRRHIEAMGGTITIDSTPGKGTLARLTFSVAVGKAQDVAADKPGPAAAQDVPASSRRRILVVDDIETNLRVLEKLLTQFGFDVRGVTGGAEAISVYQQWKPDLVLMDRAMPGMDGIETTQRIRALEGGENALIIFVTAGALDEERREIMEGGATDIVRKPFRHAELLDKIAEHLDRNSR